MNKATIIKYAVVIAGSFTGLLITEYLSIK